MVHVTTPKPPVVGEPRGVGLRRVGQQNRRNRRRSGQPTAPDLPAPSPHRQPDTGQCRVEPRRGGAAPRHQRDAVRRRAKGCVYRRGGAECLPHARSSGGCDLDHMPEIGQAREHRHVDGASLVLPVGPHRQLGALPPLRGDPHLVQGRGHHRRRADDPREPALKVGAGQDLCRRRRGWSRPESGLLPPARSAVTQGILRWSARSVRRTEGPPHAGPGPA